MDVKPNIRELTLKRGLSYPTDEELIMLILGRGVKGFPIQKMSEKIDQIVNTCEKSELVTKLTSLRGIGESRALVIAAALELGWRKSQHLNAKISKPADIIPYVKHYSIEDKEHFVFVCLSGSHEILKIHENSVGTRNRALVHPRDVFNVAIKENASALILCHNHPSGNCNPSAEDLELTEELCKGAILLGMRVLDHIILGGDSFFSFKEHNLLMSVEG